MMLNMVRSCHIRDSGIEVLSEALLVNKTICKLNLRLVCEHFNMADQMIQNS